MVAAIRYTELSELVYVVDELVLELMHAHPPVKDSLAMRPWTCKHDRVHVNWYYKEVVCPLMHDDLPIKYAGMSFTLA